MIPSNPLAASLVLEGLNQAGESNPSAALLARAQGEWMEEIKNDIWNLAKKPKILQVTACTIINMGQSRYAYPLDYSSDLDLTLLSGSYTGIAQSGSVSTIQLAASDQSGTNIIGKEIFITSGAGISSCSQVVAFNTTTKQASVVPNFTNAPTVGDGYMIIDVEYPVVTRPMYERTRQFQQSVQGLPQSLYPLGDQDEGFFKFDKAPDTTYGARLIYYADLTQVDVASSLFSTLLRRWRNIFVKGIKALKLGDEDDDREAEAVAAYKEARQVMIYREIYGMDISTITDRVSDYY